MGVNPAVSVIIPVYNRSSLIRRSVSSVLNQTYSNFEVIIVDDGSTEDIKEIIDTFKDDRIILVRHEKNKGAAVARNTGVKASSGNYIAFQDSDDEWLPDKLNKQMKAFGTNCSDVGVVYSDMWFISKSKKNYHHAPRILPKDKIIYKKALDYGVFNIGIQTAVFKRDVFEKSGLFDERFPRYIDLEYFMRISKNYYFYHVNEPLVNFYDENIARISTNNKALIEARKLILEKYYDDIKDDKRLLARHYFGIGASYCLAREFIEGEQYFKDAFNIYPELKKDRKYLSKYYFDIGYSLYIRNDIENGKEFILKSIRTNPCNIKHLLFLYRC